jgi:tetratricopeptide (TPR) repeat protein
MKASFSPFPATLPFGRFSDQSPEKRGLLLTLGIVLTGLLLGLLLWYSQGDWHRLTLPWAAPVAVPVAAPITTPITASTAGESVEPLPVPISYETAMGLRQQGDLVGAMHQLEQIALTTPASVPVLYELGRAKFQLGSVPAAVTQYRAALALDPDHAPSAYELGSILVTLGQLKEGIQHLQHAVAVSPTALAFYDLGIAYGRAGDPQAKLEALNQAIALEPGYADAHLNLGLTYARIHDLPAAKRSLQQARNLYQAEIEKLEHAHLGRNSLDAQIIDQMLLSLEAGCGVECWAVQ